MMSRGPASLLPGHRRGETPGRFSQAPVRIPGTSVDFTDAASPAMSCAISAADPLRRCFDVAVREMGVAQCHLHIMLICI